MTGEPQTNLPNSWKLAGLCEVAELNPRLNKSAHTGNPMVSFVPMPGVEAGTGAIDVSQTRSLEEVKKGYTPFREGDVLFAKITPCMENGKMAVVPPLKNGLGFGSTEFHVLRPYCETSAQYIYYFVSSEQFRRDAQHNMTGAVGQRRVPAPYLADQSVPVPPAREQHRIVAKIEELFSELDKGVESLKTARAKLNVYRQAVLKHAFKGKLTAQWREENKDKLETPERLLARIKQERAAHYEQQLKEWKAAVKAWEERGKSSKKPIKPRRQENTLPPTAEELGKLPDLPTAWQWVKLGQLVWSVKDGPHYSPKYSNSGIPFITGGNIHPTRIDFSSAKFITPELHKELSQRCKPERGDVLYTKGGTTGIARVNTYDLDFNVWVHVAVLKTTKSLEPFYLQHALNSPDCYAQSQKYTHGVGNQDLGLTRMVNIVLPLCCITEQKRIIQVAERVTCELDKIEDEIERALKEADALRQSILKKAFSGQLVAQDPNDEPASVLLDRIRAEREKATKNNHSKKTKKKKTTA